MRHSYSAIFHHIVFSTKRRQAALEPELELRLFPYLGGICRTLDARLLAVNGGCDHVHLLVLLPTTLATAELVEKLKGNSSKWLRRYRGSLWPGWQRGFAAFSVSRSRTAEVERYIRQQKEHHKRKTFEEELTALLEANGVEFNAEFLKRDSVAR
ncbi:MAG: IS200/IS605 family transposase [Acidobacteria bacterium]|nr:IS200/IS605 family transposase [Acidobacteriota bacterium]